MRFDVPRKIQAQHSVTRRVERIKASAAGSAGRDHYNLSAAPVGFPIGLPTKDVPESIQSDAAGHTPPPIARGQNKRVLLSDTDRRVRALGGVAYRGCGDGNGVGKIRRDGAIRRNDGRRVLRCYLIPGSGGTERAASIGRG